MSKKVDLWEEELIRLSNIDFDKTNDRIFGAYFSAFKDILIRSRDYIDKYESLSISQRIELQRMFATAKDFETILMSANSIVDNSILKYSTDEILRGYYGTFYKLDNILDLGSSIPMINHRYIDALLREGVDGTRFSQRLHRNVNRLIKVVETELTNGAAMGKSYSDIAESIRNQIEGEYRNAIRIARTEGQRLNGKAKQESYDNAEKIGVKFVKIWHSTSDPKTRRTHQELDGQQVAPDEYFINRNGDKALHPGGFGLAHEDINCRCTTVTEIDSFKASELNEKYRSFMVLGGSYKDWLNKLEKEGL